MKAIVQEEYGPPDVLELREVDTPVPADSEVLVRVHAVAVNARDWHVMRGDPYVARLLDPSGLGFRRPKIKIRGTDFAGRVPASWTPAGRKIASAIAGATMVMGWSIPRRVLH